MMITTDEQLERVFRDLHDIPEKDDVRVVEDEDGISVCLFKNDSWCWGTTVAEMAFDLIFQQQVSRRAADKV